jgi:hypothetical protein
MNPLSNIFKNIINDLTNIKFYKKKQFIVFISYILILLYIYIFEYDLVKYYILGKNKRLTISDLFFYPIGNNDITQLLTSLFTNPIQIFTLLFAIILPFFIDIKKNNFKQYCYTVILSFVLTTILLILHSSIFKTFIDPNSIDISEEYKVNKKNRTYNSLYGSQWMLLYIISPIYSFIIFYFQNKLF